MSSSRCYRNGSIHDFQAWSTLSFLPSSTSMENQWLS